MDNFAHHIHRPVLIRSSNILLYEEEIVRRSRNEPTRQPLDQINNKINNTEFPGVEDD